jgi:hypothetical protein
MDSYCWVYSALYKLYIYICRSVIKHGNGTTNGHSTGKIIEVHCEFSNHLWLPEGLYIYIGICLMGNYICITSINMGKYIQYGDIYVHIHKPCMGNDSQMFQYITNLCSVSLYIQFSYGDIYIYTYINTHTYIYIHIKHVHIWWD